MQRLLGLQPSFEHFEDGVVAGRQDGCDLVKGWSLLGEGGPGEGRSPILAAASLSLAPAAIHLSSNVRWMDQAPPARMRVASSSQGRFVAMPHPSAAPAAQAQREGAHRRGSDASQPISHETPPLSGSRRLSSSLTETSSLNRYPIPCTVSMNLDCWGSSPSLLPEPADVDVEGAGAAGELVAPHLFEQRLTIDGLAAPHHQEGEEVKLLGSQLDLPFPDVDAVPFPVDVELSGAQVCQDRRCNWSGEGRRGCAPPAPWG